jgi:hypothetical protein
MAYDVFISHSSKDKLTADAICHSLEQNGVRCWIAPRDVQAGANYGAEITRGIRESKLLLLIFSASSNISSAVHREIETAFSNGKTIVPYRIENVKISDEISFYIAGNHWLDAYPNDKVFADLVANIRKLLEKTPLAGQSVSTSSGQMSPTPFGLSDRIRRFTPKGIAEVTLKGNNDTETVYHVIANTLLYHYTDLSSNVTNYVSNGLYKEKIARPSSHPEYKDKLLFKDMKEIIMTGGDDTSYKAMVCMISGEEIEIDLFDASFISQARKAGRFGYLVLKDEVPEYIWNYRSVIKSIRFDWDKPVNKMDYMLLSFTGSQPLLTLSDAILLIQFNNTPSWTDWSTSFYFIDQPPIPFKNIDKLTLVETIRDEKTHYKFQGAKDYRIKIVTISGKEYDRTLVRGY